MRIQKLSRRRCVTVAIVSLAGIGAAPPPEPQGFRTSDYRAATPATLAGARVLSTREASDLWKDNAAAFVDVLPQPPRPPALPPDTIWQPRPRMDIPGSVWLPDTGYGELAPGMAEYFRDGLRRVTRNDMSRLIVFYCQANCWMSWNAAKRAQAFGYTSVAWFPEGTDGWAAAGLPLARGEPLPRPSE